MISRYSRRLVLLALALGCVLPCLAQNAEVRRKVYLRSSPDVKDKSLILLKPGDELELVDQAPTDGFLHVRTEDGEEGWVKEQNVTVAVDASKIIATLAAPSGNVSDLISGGWEKPEPNKSTFHG